MQLFILQEYPHDKYHPLVPILKSQLDPEVGIELSRQMELKRKEDMRRDLRINNR